MRHQHQHQHQYVSVLHILCTSSVCANATTSYHHYSRAYLLGVRDPAAKLCLPKDLPLF